MRQELQRLIQKWRDLAKQSRKAARKAAGVATAGALEARAASAERCARELSDVASRYDVPEFYI